MPRLAPPHNMPGFIFESRRDAAGPLDALEYALPSDLGDFRFELLRARDGEQHGNGNG